MWMSLQQKDISSSLVPEHHCLLTLNLHYIEYLATNCDSAVYPVCELCLPSSGLGDLRQITQPLPHSLFSYT